MREFFRKLNHRHYVCLFLTLGFLACGFFFPYAFERLIESIRDLFLSIGYYFQSLLHAFSKGKISVTVEPSVLKPSNIPFKPILNFPATWKLFKDKWGVFWQTFASSETILSFFEQSSDKFLIFYQIFMCLFPVLILYYLIVVSSFSDVNHNDNVDSKSLKFLKTCSDKIYRPCKQYIKEFLGFLKCNKKWLICFALIWSFYFNFVSIAFEAIAFYLCACFAGNIFKIFLQIDKLFLDLSVVIRFIPGLFWFIDMHPKSWTLLEVHIFYG